MEFRHLRYFVVLAEELHFGRAAQRLAITQPPLSLNIQQLEASLGARLFERDSKGVRLTAAGQAFHAQALALLAQADQARALVRGIDAGIVGRLRVGFVGSVLLRGLPQWLAAHQAEQPGIEIALAELNSQAQIDALLRDELELGFVHTPHVLAPLRSQRVHSDAFMACVPAAHALALRPKLSLLDLRDEAFVLFSRRDSPDYHMRIVQMCGAVGFHPKLRHEVRHWLSVVALVGQGMGVSVVPEPLQRSGIAGAVFKPLVEDVPPSPVHAVWRAGTALPARDQFLQRVLASG